MREQNGFKVAAIQMVSSEDIAENLHVAEDLIASAKEQGANLVALPEYFALISRDETAKISIREKDGAGPLQKFLKEMAQRHRIYLVAGTLPLEADNNNKVRNTTLVFEPDGTRLARYDKLHLFGFDSGTEHYDEAATIENGHEIVTFESPIGRVGLAICYDLRFPELFRAFGKVNLIILPAAFTYTTGVAHWEVLLRARAIENQCYVLASAQGGKHASGRHTYGHSMLIDPWGEVIARQDSGEGVVIGSIDLNKIEDVRTRLPALTHRRLNP